MNKKGFLEELGTYLAVLEEREQQDILEEYAQHIDMKIEKGLSEEEAIRDFCDIRELAAGILEAYHVNPEYQGTHGGRRKTDTESAAVKTGLDGCGRPFWKRGNDDKKVLLRLRRNAQAGSKTYMDLPDRAVEKRKVGTKQE